MKKIIIPLIVSAPLFFIAPSFAATDSILYNPELRTNSVNLSGVNALPKAGATYAYWHRGHWHHRHYYRHWNRGHWYYRDHHHRYWHRHYY